MSHLSEIAAIIILCAFAMASCSSAGLRVKVDGVEHSITIGGEK